MAELHKVNTLDTEDDPSWSSEIWIWMLGRCSGPTCILTVAGPLLLLWPGSGPTSEVSLDMRRSLSVVHQLRCLSDWIEPGINRPASLH